VSDLPILDELRGDLLAAMRAAEAPRPRRWTTRPLLFAAPLFLALAATAAAATFYVLRASPIAPFAAEDTVPEQRVEAGTSRVFDLRAADPDPDAPPWALRIGRSQTGLLCGTVGQVEGGEFGIVGLDGRFRVLPEANADACGLSVPGAPALLGTRVFDADEDDAVRTVVNGVAVGVERVSIAARGGRPEPVEISPEGGFLRAFAGFPEDVQPVVTLRYPGGRERRYAFAHSPNIVPDPLGGRAWKVELVYAGGRRACAWLVRVRPRAREPRPRQLCGDRALFYGARRVAQRTVLWGAAGRNSVRELVVSGPDGLRRSVRPEGNRAFLVVLDPQVDPADLRVEVRYEDGRVRRTGHDHGHVR
jgi:hypothetical protein